MHAFLVPWQMVGVDLETVECDKRVEVSGPWFFLSRHQCIKSDAGSYRTSGEGVKQWGGVEQLTTGHKCVNSVWDLIQKQQPKSTAGTRAEVGNIKTGKKKNIYKVQNQETQKKNETHDLWIKSHYKYPKLTVTKMHLMLQEQRGGNLRYVHWWRRRQNPWTHDMKSGSWVRKLLHGIILILSNKVSKDYICSYDTLFF